MCIYNVLMRETTTGEDEEANKKKNYVQMEMKTQLLVWPSVSSPVPVINVMGCFGAVDGQGRGKTAM